MSQRVGVVLAGGLQPAPRSDQGRAGLRGGDPGPAGGGRRLAAVRQRADQRGAGRARTRPPAFRSCGTGLRGGAARWPGSTPRSASRATPISWCWPAITRGSAPTCCGSSFRPRKRRTTSSCRSTGEGGDHPLVALWRRRTAPLVAEAVAGGAAQGAGAPRGLSGQAARTAAFPGPGRGAGAAQPEPARRPGDAADRGLSSRSGRRPWRE